MKKRICFLFFAATFPIRTDNSTFVDCRLDDGRLVRLKFSQTDYPSQIDGVNVEDLFEGLVYAG